MSKLKLTLALIGAFAAGGGLGVLLTKNHFEKKYSEEAEKAISEARAALIKRMHKDTPEEVSEPQEASESDLEGVSESSSGFDEFGQQKDAPEFDPKGYLQYHEASPDADKPSLEDLAKRREDLPQPNDDGSEFGYNEEDPNFIEDFMDRETEDFTKRETEEIDVYQEHLDDGQRDGDPNGRAPYEISEHEYLYGDRSFGKVCLTYYKKDKVLCDDDGSPVNIDTYVGRRAIMQLRREPAVYVRNERLGMDYEVDAMDGWFNEPSSEDDEE